jgi:hypothetical protein
MDDYSVNSLGESKNEWCARLINVLTPELIQGLKSIFDEAWKLCQSNDEEDKYLLVFQTFLSRVPKWNPNNIQDEVNRIIEKSGCSYLEELLTCVHVIHLKILTCVRVGQRQKKVDIDVPSLKDFIHKVYINIARKVYTNIYLFEKNIPPLQIQKNNRELEVIIKECILNTVRESIPVDSILRAYMDETEEQDVEVREVEEKIPAKVKPAAAAAVPAAAAQEAPIVAEPVIIKQQAAPLAAAAAPLATAAAAPFGERITFSDVDNAMDSQGNRSELVVPKTDENLLAIEKRNEKQNYAESDDEEEEEDKLRIGADVNLDFTDVNDISQPLFINTLPPLLDDIVVLT